MGRDRRIEGHRKQLSGKDQKQWGKADDKQDVAASRRDQIAGKIQARYGMAREDAERQIADWQNNANDAWFVRK